MTEEVRLPEQAYAVSAVTANSVARRYRGVVEREDLNQEALLWCVRKNHKVWEWLDDEAEDADVKSGEAYLATSIRNHLERYCRREKARQRGYRTQDEAFYDLGQIDEILEHVFAYGDWQSNPVVGDKVKTGSDPATGGNWTAACADVARAITQLEIPQQFVLRLRYEQHMKLKDIGGMFDKSHEWARVELEKAKEELVDQLGGENPWA